ncbi:MAG: glycosyltransferase family 2 protein [Anaerolineales bacterium]|nr:glycosyltransferase family 2 protein [Anaerolineales bacterium]MCS7247953.1 glycosyltransferase family 2 protein [Anaerolineales bacterium]MDW8161764.1 glycosyltransferase family 2 protein [Anaerolineales bacterium]MDW8448229.1 glycosyltransferase family 2 protein [Anaerolineales bacterium]
MENTFSSLLTIVVPVYNEGQVLDRTVQTVVPFAAERSWEVIFVDDGSTDNSGEILDKLSSTPHVRVVKHKVNRGYGAALKSGISRVKTPYVVTFDADGQHCVEDIERSLRYAIQNNSDLVVGSRQGAGKQDRYRALGKWIIRRFARFLMPLRVVDLNSGFKLYRTELVRQYLPLCPNSMAFSDVITLVFTHQRHLIHELPITVQPRPSGRSAVNTWTALETVLEILNAMIMLNPLRLFIPLSLASILAGVSWGGYLIIRFGRGVSVGSMLAVVSGLIFFMLGLLAHQISNLRLDLARSNYLAEAKERGDFEQFEPVRKDIFQ